MSTSGQEESDSPSQKRPRKLDRRSLHRSVDEGIAADLFDHDSYDASNVFDRRDSELPDLPVDEHSFLHSDPGFILPPSGDANESVDEHEMRRHFMDVESSFLPDAAPVAATAQQQGTLGVDDTYLELGKPGRTPPPDEMFESLSGRKALSLSKHLHVADVDLHEREGLQEAGSEEEREMEEDSAGAEVEDSLSSPAAAYVFRVQGRSVPIATVGGVAQEHRSLTSVEAEDQADVNAASTMPIGHRPTSKGSTVRPGSSPRPETASQDQADSRQINAASGSLFEFGARPMHNRQVSELSAISYSTLDSDVSGGDANGERNHGLGSLSNAASSNGGLRSTFLSRLPSFGSTASNMDRDGEAAPTPRRGASNISLLASMRAGRFNEDVDERPETPRASTNTQDAPTDTVIAQHVQSIQVPETIARDFRTKNRSLSPGKQRPATSDSPGTATINVLPRRNLTLKEQNSKIDKLTKENFDLKLKIHFLDQALQSRSDDGVKELIDKNVQLQTDLANERKESQALRRKLRELERKAQAQEESLSQALQDQQTRNAKGDEEVDDDPTLQAEMHEEILYLRQQLDYSENKVTTLTEDVMTKEFEKRKMAEHMRSMAGHRGEDVTGMKETMDMWQDLLNAETGRREQAEEDIRKLSEELSALRIERASPAPNRFAKRRSKLNLEENVDDDTEHVNGFEGSAVGSSVTLVDHLKHENAELRRDLGAQTSMLTSRNRERERLQQEIEDLKLLQRKSDGARSIAGDSIFDRSISRAQHRAPSRASEAPTAVTEAEREDWDKKEGQLRDQNASLKLRFQELERTHTTHLQYVSVLEADFQQMESELNEVSEDNKALQSERDEALHAFEEKDSELGKLEQDALAEIDKLEKECETLQMQLADAHKKQQKTSHKFEHMADGYKGLQGELRDITQSVMNLEDEKQASMRTIETLEQQLAETEDELQKWEQKCKEIDQKNRKLEITQESLHSEITFLREEQEGDKIKIGELEDALNAAQQTIQDEQEKLREMEEGMVEERQQRDVLENKSKAEVQRVLDDLNGEGQKTKDEVRRLRRGLSAKEVEASSWKQKLDEYEQALRNAIGDQSGTKSSLLADIEKLQRDVETTADNLDRAKMDLADKDRLLRHRDGLLESTSLESRRLSDLLDKERASRRHDLEQFEKSSRGQASHIRTIAQHESRVLDLEATHMQEKRRMATLEQQYREQLSERNTLLLALWNRLSTLCGTDWAQSHSLVGGESPSTDVVARRLPAFNQNLMLAIKTVEALIGSFKARVKSIEKDLFRDYQTLEHNLELRMKRMDSLEAAVHSTQQALAAEAAQRPRSSGTSLGSRDKKSSEEISRLKTEVKGLKSELKFHRQHPSAMAQQMIHQQASTNPDNHARRISSSAGSIKSTTSPARAMMSQLLRHRSSSAVEQLQNVDEDTTPRQQQSIVLPPASTAHTQPSEQRWAFKFRELERRLKAEREGRLLDREDARQRLEEGRLEKEELRVLLEHERVRKGDFMETSSVAGSERERERVEVDGERRGSGVEGSSGAD